MNPFKKGDIVICITGEGNALKSGQTFEVLKATEEYVFISLPTLFNKEWSGWNWERFEKAKEVDFTRGLNK